MKKENTNYIIDFLSLKEGKYNFNFRIDKSFLSLYQNLDINDLDIYVKANLEKTSRNLIFNFIISGNLNVQCDRCLDYFDLPIKYKTNLNVNFGKEASDLTDIDDTMTLIETKDTIDLSKHFYDYILLQMPIRKVHSNIGDNKCNEEMLEHISRINTKNDSEEIDQRWEKLKTLYN